MPRHHPSPREGGGRGTMTLPRSYVEARVEKTGRWNRGMAIMAGGAMVAASMLLTGAPAFSAGTAYPTTVSIAPASSQVYTGAPFTFTATVSCTAGADVCVGGHPSNPGDILGKVTFQSRPD